nr:hypothetical protein [Desulfobacterales bacterium]
MKANNVSNFFPHPFFRTSRSWKLFAVLAIVLACIALDDVPLDVQQQQAPGIVMFLIDDSGSMDWEFMCPEAEGKFRSTSDPDYEYVFANPGDHSYSSS